MELDHIKYTHTQTHVRINHSYSQIVQRITTDLLYNVGLVPQSSNTLLDSISTRDPSQGAQREAPIVSSSHKHRAWAAVQLDLVTYDDFGVELTQE